MLKWAYQSILVVCIEEHVKPEDIPETGTNRRRDGRISLGREPTGVLSNRSTARVGTQGSSVPSLPSSGGTRRFCFTAPVRRTAPTATASVMLLLSYGTVRTLGWSSHLCITQRPLFTFGIRGRGPRASSSDRPMYSLDPLFHDNPLFQCRFPDRGLSQCKQRGTLRVTTTWSRVLLVTASFGCSSGEG
eukprot:1193577-Prorocentrum_minimum.AAC.1